MAGGETNPFNKTICSICYEDLKPIIEDLQSISVCGHVFHELCLQQWFEYCKGKKKSCPVCKQNCTNSNAGRLYFQSIGNQNDVNLTQKPHSGNHEEIPDELRIKIEKLVGKANSLASSLEFKNKEFQEVKDELTESKGQLAVEVRLKNEAQAEKAAIQRLLYVKSEELDKSTLECMRVKDRNMALAKELAALKLASDLNLDEEEIMKLASLGNGTGSKETVDVLRKSLAIRNKSYKELMSKCNILGRGEARSLSKLEKANEKMKKLKLRVQELETRVEMKDNEALRALKDQDCRVRKSSEGSILNATADETRSDIAVDISFCSSKIETQKPSNRKRMMSTSNPNDDEDFVISGKIKRFSNENVVPCTDNIAKSCQVQEKDATFESDIETDILRPCSNNSLLMGVSKSHGANEPEACVVDDDEVICYGETKPVESSIQPSGGNCFSGGLLGPDGTNWHLGKWCKKAPSSNPRSGDLISVGADGRGGTIKVMKSLSSGTSSSLGKKSKLGVKTSKLKSQGHLQIDHFFQRNN